jgi:hypothetical protein
LLSAHQRSQAEAWSFNALTKSGAGSILFFWRLDEHRRIASLLLPNQRPSFEEHVLICVIQ